MPQKQYGNRLEEKNIRKLIWSMCTQTTLSILLYNIYMITDTLYVTRGIGSVAGGAIGIYMPAGMLINGITSTLATGSSSCISRKLGEQDSVNSKAIIGCAVWVWILCAALITAAGMVFLNPILFLLGCTGAIYPYAVVYCRIMFAGTILSTGFSGIMRAEGDIAYAMQQWCIPVMINMLLDPLFIFVFHWGIAGAAFATVLAQFYAVINSIYYFFFRKATPCRIMICDIRWNQKSFQEIMKIGMPSLLNSICQSLTGTIGNQILGQVGGAQAISVYTVTSRILSLLATPYTGMMQGIQPILGYDYGRKRWDRLGQTVRYAFRIAAGYGILIWLCSQIMTVQLLQIFMKDPMVVAKGEFALRILSTGLLVGGVLPIVQACFQAYGFGKRVLQSGMISMLLIKLPLILITGYLRQITAVWTGLALGDLLTAFLAIGMYSRYIRKNVFESNRK
ncbi:MAG: MATE family efflux transporter [Butyrivibrio sp.]|nr:MATE family efflux transporter [Butyrivibrio sp.]